MVSPPLGANDQYRTTKKRGAHQISSSVSRAHSPLLGVRANTGGGYVETHEPLCYLRNAHAL